MTEPKRKQGRPATGRLSPLENKQALLSTGGRIMQVRLTAEPNHALIKLKESGEFTSSTKAISAALIEAAKRRKL